MNGVLALAVGPVALLFFVPSSAVAAEAGAVAVCRNTDSPLVEFAAEEIQTALGANGFAVSLLAPDAAPAGGGPIYRAGAVMLDLENPAKVVGRCMPPILGPREIYERVGDIGNVVFVGGALVEPDGEVKVYYGAADTSICVATAPLQDIIDCCFECDD